MTALPALSAAARFHAVDVADPLPSWNQLADAAGFVLELNAPGEACNNIELRRHLYWPALDGDDCS